MKLQHLSPSILLLFPAISTAFGNPSPAQGATKPSIAPFKATNLDAIQPGKYQVDGSKIVLKGALDVPVDGKDGRPHAGPWVETSAERDRKNSGYGSASNGKAKIDTPASTLDHLGPDGKSYPHSNDGVMDDRNRGVPQQGTRGTEGGVSEKQKIPASGEKVPGSPKEAPPLPNSEKQKVPGDGYTVGKDSKGYGSDANLGVLEVLFSLPFT